MLCNHLSATVGRREVVRHYQDVFELSERRVCQAMGFGRACHRYQSRRDPAVELRMRLKELAESRVRSDNQDESFASIWMGMSLEAARRVGVASL